MKKLIAFIIVMLVSISSANACSFDTDCQPGSSCIKNGGLYGACVGGIAPGNSNDRRPVSPPLDVNGTYGNTCNFNTDCGPGSTCVKDGITGTCMK